MNNLLLSSTISELLGFNSQSLLQLANFYAISKSSSSPLSKSNSLRDKIGLCYVFKNRLSSSDEVLIPYLEFCFVFVNFPILVANSTCPRSRHGCTVIHMGDRVNLCVMQLKVAYSPRGNFNLRDFHHAVNSLPSDAFLPDNDNRYDVTLSTVLSDRVLYSWQGKDIERKAIVITSFLPEDVDSTMQKSLMDAADKCVSVDFAVFQQKSSHLIDTRENINNFRRCISHLDNCSFQIYIPDFRVLRRLVKRWLQVLKDDMEDPLQACFTFKDNLLDSVNHIFCNLYAAAIPMINGFSQCQTCRCHGIPLGDAETNKFNGLSCPVTGSNLETHDVVDNSVRVGEKTILFLPSFRSSLNLPQIDSRIDISVLERTNLTSVNEGLIMGTSFVVIPSPCQVIESTSDDADQSDLNAQLFQGLSSILHSMDQGLICSSNCDLETMTQVAFHCFYILQPSDKGPMLLRRLAGAEEVLRVSDTGLDDSSVNKEIENSVEACLLKIDLAPYDPLLHERGVHQKLNLLVKESLQFGSIHPNVGGVSSELSKSEQRSSEVIGKAEVAIEVIHVDEETLPLDLTTQEDKTIACITEEWEQLVVKEDPKMYSPSCMSKAKLDQSCVLPRDGSRQLDRETSRILERLEVPRPLKTNASVPTKKPLIPLQPIQAIEPVLVGSQLMKPNFQRLKRKHK